ncbi:DNA polymerase III subunit gamma/tau [Bartonella ancashensis]|uniref:DNA polymerase III subunit gamma/tau n=1 Tax=Bartonella ancashensis TaxID=1318743 RepID=A0A0M4M362_9HYPH|nr:DNA polymerase III subunit gamma/tau [Bartonella ancashensis]ALE03412.1 DNA polymerase III subunits gamma and tau [Bartonella ancashensis]
MNHMPTGIPYRVLARKYRPHNFSDLIGQEAMVCTLTNSFKTGRIAQAWILTGIRGVGKTTTARILARALNYETKDINQPTTALHTFGEHCTQIIEGRHIDVIEMDAASHTGIDDIREIINQIQYRPVSARYKIYIIDEVHMLSTQAFNGLLKTLEEPPTHVKFIFATTEIRKVPITILSRCQRFDLRRVESAVLVDHLRKISQSEKIEIQEQALSIIARASEGSVRDALSILDQAISYGNGKINITTIRTMLGLADQARIIDLFEYIMAGDIVKALHELRNQYDAGAAPLTILTELANFNYLVTRLRFIPQTTEDLSLTEEERLRSLNFSQKLSVRVLSRNWQMLLKGIQEINQSAHPIQAAEMLLIRLAHSADLPTLDEVIEKFIDSPSSLATTHDRSYQKSQNMNDEERKGKFIHTSERVQNQNFQIQSLNERVAFSSQKEEHSNFSISRNTNFREMEEITNASSAAELSFNAPGLSNISTQSEIKNTSSPIMINSLHDIVNLAKQYGEVQFIFLIEEFVQPVSFEPGYIKLKLAEGAPHSLPSDIEKMLYQWTGQSWIVTQVNEGARLTLREESVVIQKTLFSDAQGNSDVTKILDHFPGSKIVDVRFNKQDDDINSKSKKGN